MPQLRADMPEGVTIGQMAAIASGRARPRVGYHSREDANVAVPSQ